MKIGIDLGGTNVRIALVKKEVIVKRDSIAWHSKENLESTLSQLKKLIRSMENPSVESIGIGVPSVVDTEKGIVYNVANINSWKEVRLKEILEKEFRLPVYVNNDSNCFALGEKEFGKAKPYSDAVIVTLGTGVGAGLILNDRLYAGKNTGAGEIGSIPYLEHDYEHYCSSGFFVRHHHLSGEEAGRLASVGDKNALKIWDEFGQHVGNLIKTILFVYDPQAVVIGGGIAPAYPFFSGKMFEAISGFPYKETTKRLKIIPSDNNDSALLGASALSRK